MVSPDARRNATKKANTQLRYDITKNNAINAKRNAAKTNGQKVIQLNNLKKRDAQRKSAAKANQKAIQASRSKKSGGSSSGSSGGSSGSSGTGSSGTGSSGTGTGADGVGGTGTGADGAEEVIENKYNDISGFFNPEEEEFIASTDTPTVRIWISREKVPDEDVEEGEGESETTEGEKIETVEEAARESVDIANMYKKNEINNTNNAFIKTNDQKILAMKAIADIDFNELDFGEDANTEEILKKMGLL